MMSGMQPRRDGFSVLVAAGVIFAAMVFYPLSAGPVGWAIMKAGKPAWTEPIFATVYYPALCLPSHDRTGLLAAYYHWWWN
jgi:hypothetical protein